MYSGDADWIADLFDLNSTNIDFCLTLTDG